MCLKTVAQMTTPSILTTTGREKEREREGERGRERERERKRERKRETKTSCANYHTLNTHNASVHVHLYRPPLPLCANHPAHHPEVGVCACVCVWKCASMCDSVCVFLCVSVRERDLRDRGG